MLMPLLLAYDFMYKLVAGPALIILLAAALILAVKFSSFRLVACGCLLLAGFLEAAVALFIWGFLIGFFIGLITFALGVLMLLSAWRPINSFFSSVWAKLHLKRRIGLKRGLMFFLPR